MSPKRSDGSEKKAAQLHAQMQLDLYDEKKVAVIAGVRRRFIVRWRQALGARAEDWGTRSGRVGLTRTGVCKALAAVSVRADLERIERDALLEQKKGAVSVRVFRLPMNTRVLLCSRIEMADMAVVRVRDNTVFRVGDEFDAYEEGGVLVHHGDWPERGW